MLTASVLNLCSHVIRAPPLSTNSPASFIERLAEHVIVAEGWRRILLAMGAGAVEKFDAECAARMSTFNTMAERLYMNWLQMTARAG